MNTQSIFEILKKSNQTANKVQKHTFIVNEKSETLGALFFITIASKEYKILIPSPFHSSLFLDNQIPTYAQILSHKEALLLK